MRSSNTLRPRFRGAMCAPSVRNDRGHRSCSRPKPSRTSIWARSTARSRAFRVSDVRLSSASRAAWACAASSCFVRAASLRAKTLAPKASVPHNTTPTTNHSSESAANARAARPAASNVNAVTWMMRGAERINPSLSLRCASDRPGSLQRSVVIEELADQLGNLRGHHVGLAAAAPPIRVRPRQACALDSEADRFQRRAPPEYMQAPSGADTPAPRS